MAISFPLSMPAPKGPSSVVITARSAVGTSVSPFTYSQQLFVHQGEMWEAQIDLPPMLRDAAAEWVAFLVKMNGMEGSFLMGPPETSQRGTWAGFPQLAGLHNSRSKTLTVEGFTPGATGKEMDWIQFGSGAETRLHQVVQDFTANANGIASVEIWPGLRESQNDQAAFVTLSPKGTWRLNSNLRQWTVSLGMIYGFSFSCIEALTV